MIPAPEAPVSALPGFHAEDVLTGLSLTNQKEEASFEPVTLTLGRKVLLSALQVAVDITDTRGVLPILRLRDGNLVRHGRRRSPPRT